MMRLRALLMILLSICLVACRGAQEEVAIDVVVHADGQETTYSFAQDLTVDQVLASARIELGPRDRISHPLVSPVINGMRVTIRRVAVEEFCEQEDILFRRRVLPKEGLSAGETQLGQQGLPGKREVCYQVTLEDGIEVSRAQLGLPVNLRAPLDEIVYEGPRQTAPPVPIKGRLSYINHQNAWTIVGDAAKKRLVTAGQKLDGLVFDQRQDGRFLIFTSETAASDEFFNELWLVAVDGGGQPMRMTPTDLLFAQWRPRTSNEIAYSTGERSAGATGWKALNNLWRMSIDIESARALSIVEALPEASGGVYGWWGKDFAWSPLGDKLAYVAADGFGVVDFDSRRLAPLAQYPVFHSAADWVWLSALSWSFDGGLLAGVTHGAPLGAEPAETSPIFDVVVAGADGRFTAPIVFSAGMWAAPAFSPDLAPRGSEFGQGRLAWLQAREPENSMSGEYDLMLADRDGSNRRRLFPQQGAPGIRRSDFGRIARDFVWSPEGNFIALIYQGDLWLLAAETGAAHQVTFDGNSSNPVWTR